MMVSLNEEGGGGGGSHSVRTRVTLKQSKVMQKKKKKKAKGSPTDGGTTNSIRTLSFTGPSVRVPPLTPGALSVLCERRVSSNKSPSPI